MRRNRAVADLLLNCRFVKISGFAASMLIRRKITLALIVANLTVIAAVGLVAYQTLRQKFSEQTARVALENFRGDVSLYIETYGSWEAALATEPFGAIVARRSRQLPRPQLVGLGQPAITPPDSERSVHTPRPTADVSSSPSGAGWRPPPFHFLVFSPAGRVLKAIPPYRVGDTISEADRVSALPIEVSGKIVAYAARKGDVAYSDLDLGYLAAIRQALWLGVLAGLALALAVGWLLGTRLSSRLRGLTRAVESVQAGHFDQQVEIGSADEVGDLARAFNQMNDELRRGRDALKASYSRIEEQSEMLRELSNRDALTQLHNRRYFDQQIAKVDRSADSGTAVALGDVDFFKQINDRFSHATGDNVLRQVGEILQQNTRRTDIVARYGGEEFVVAFTDITSEQAYVLCEKLRQAIADYRWQSIAPALQLTMSFGLCFMSKDVTPSEALRCADRLLYQAKAEGRNRVCVATVDDGCDA